MSALSSSLLVTLETSGFFAAVLAYPKPHSLLLLIKFLFMESLRTTIGTLGEPRFILSHKDRTRRVLEIRKSLDEKQTFFFVKVEQQFTNN